MLCCVSRRTVVRTDQVPPYDHCPPKVQSVQSDIVQLEQYSESDVPPILLPCAICARTFMPQSLEKHSRICERTAARKRRVFDSAKQRIQGTELQGFRSRQEKKRQNEKASRSSASWKQNHDEFLRAIRAARCEVVDSPMQKQCSNSMAPSSAPTRANEQGTCPTCNRNFGIKAYDRHVAWCKDRAGRVTLSPATNIAKERLEARMKYRAPLKNNRQANREKYSPGSAVTLNLGNKTTLTTARAKETVSAPNCNKGNESPVKQKPVVKRSGQTKETSSPIGPMKSRPIDRTNRPPDDETRPAPPVKRISQLPVPPLKHKKECLEECDNVQSQRHKRQPWMTHESPSYRSKQDPKQQQLLCTRSQRLSIVTARSQGKPKLNDVSINNDVTEIMVKPCRVHKGNQLTTWKRISHEKDQTCNNSEDVGHPRHPMLTARLFEPKDRSIEYSVNVEQVKSSIELNQVSDTLKKDARSNNEDTTEPISENASSNWPLVHTPRLNRTYSFKYDDLDDEMASKKKWQPVKHSPRVEFCLGDLERVSRLHFSSLNASYLVKLNANDQSRTIRAATEDQPLLDDLPSQEQTSLENLDFKSSRSKILEKKRLTSSALAQFSRQNVERTQVDSEQGSARVYPVEKNDTVESNDLTRTNDESSPSCEKLELSGHSDTSDDTKLQAPVSPVECLYHESLKDSAIKKEDTSDEPEARQPTSCSVKENEIDSDAKSVVESIRDELEFSLYSIKNDEPNSDVKNVEPFRDELELSLHSVKENEPDSVAKSAAESFRDELELFLHSVKENEPDSVAKSAAEPFRDELELFLHSVKENEPDSVAKSAAESFRDELELFLHSVKENEPDSVAKSAAESFRDELELFLHSVKENEPDSVAKSAAESFRDELELFLHSVKENEPDSVAKSAAESFRDELELFLHSVKENEPDSVKKSAAEPFRDELEFSAAISEYDDDFAPSIAMEPEPLLTQHELRLNRSSTPFDSVLDPLDTNCVEYDTSREESGTPMNEWKMTIDADRGAEMLYRVEPKVTHCSIVHDQAQKSTNIDFERKVTESRQCSSNTCCKDLQQDGVARTFTESVSTDVSTFLFEQKEEIAKEVLRKDTASQTSLCKCRCDYFEFKRENDTRIEESFEFEPPGDNPGEDNPLENRSTRCSTIKEESSEMLATLDFEDSREHELQTEQCGRNLDKSVVVDPDDNSFVDSIKLTEVQEIYKNRGFRDLDYDSDNTVKGNAIRNATNESPMVGKNGIDVRNLRSLILSESRVKLKKSNLKTCRSKPPETESKLFKSNNSSDSLSTVDEIEIDDVRQVKSVEVETIEEFGTRNKSIRFRILPEIKETTVIVKGNCEAETINAQTYWEKASKATKNRLINLDPPYQGASRFLKRNPKVRILPPVPSNTLIKCRNLTLPLRPVWSNYVRRRPDFNLVLSGRTGKDYDPFLLAEQQMNDLSDASEQSTTNSPPLEQNREVSFPLSHSSAFVKYPHQPSFSNPEKRTSLIAPPTEFDDLTSDFSSDSTETNSLSREVFLADNKELKDSKADVDKRSPARELGRRVIIDKSKALGGGDVDDTTSRGSRSFVGSTDRARKILDKVSPKVVRPTVNRSCSVRAASAPKTTPDRKPVNSSQESKESRKRNESQRSSSTSLNNRNNNYVNLSSSNLSLSSIVSSDVDIKRSNSVFDELMTSFEDENGSFPSLKSLLKNDSLSSPIRGRQRGEQISDEELSSPESYKRQDHSKLSGDSAYSSLNRKYSHHGRSTNDVVGRLEEDLPRHNRRNGDTLQSKCKMSKFCHECGSRFPETAKFCCECGIRRLVL
ncbi:uncharacterized protein LOC143154845 [Ptiloglossa arizonensis]|uniref:uncharacterized protein LOC143154845 n=1 Tax=Ptiloglossa arizonensis TaxID=3350558 RepID=UPI003FA17C2B